VGQVVGGEDVPEGEEKPRPAPLQLAAAGLQLEGLQPAQCLYVGDHPVDVLAAKAAGMRHLTVLTGEAALRDFEAAGLPDPPRVQHVGLVPAYVEALLLADGAPPKL
jgi:beta-phosphoglucomutase-like phosphatase (HAD superfamily)